MSEDTELDTTDYKAIVKSDLESAAKLGYTDIMISLKSLPPNFINIDKLFVWAATYGHLDTLKALVLYAPLDPSQAKGNWLNEAFYFAVVYNYIDVVKYLSAWSNIDMVGDNNDPLKAAIWHGWLDIVKFLSSIPAIAPAFKDIKLQESLNWSNRAAPVMRKLLEFLR